MLKTIVLSAALVGSLFAIVPAQAASTKTSDFQYMQQNAVHDRAAGYNWDAAHTDFGSN